MDISVQDLRRIVKEDLGLREDRQTLIFGTRVLKNNNTLESYGVKAGSEIFLVDISQEEIVNITAKNIANESEITYTS